MSAAVVEETTDPQAEALAALDALGPAETEPARDAQPATKPRRRSRSGTSGAERARRAKEAAAGGPAATKARTPRKASGAPKIADGMAQLYTMVGLGVSMVPSGAASAVPAGTPAGASVTNVVGMQLVANAAAIGTAWEDAAKADARVKDALEKLLAVSVFGQIVAAHLPVVLGGLAAAGLAPGELVGFAPVVTQEPPADTARAYDGQNTGGRP